MDQTESIYRQSFSREDVFEIKICNKQAYTIFNLLLRGVQRFMMLPKFFVAHNLGRSVCKQTKTKEREHKKRTV